MNEKVSLFDIGLLRLEQALNKDVWYNALIGTKPLWVRVDYKWEKNRIEIEYWYNLTQGYEGELRKSYYELQATLKKELKGDYQEPKKEPDINSLLKEAIMFTIDGVKSLQFNVDSKKFSFFPRFGKESFLGTYFEHKGGIK